MTRLYRTANKVAAFALLATAFSSCLNSKNQEQVQYDLLVEKAMIVDGTGEASYTANLLISGDSIAKIDRDTTAKYTATRTINARGLVLTPGFIDPHAHGNPLQTPELRNFLAMGVTTIFLGQDGFSPEQADLSLWMDSVTQKRPAVNVGMFVGHNTLRMLSGTKYDSVPSATNMAAMEKLLADAMESGSFGMTTGLEYNPGYYARPAELNSLAKVVGAKNGMIMSHMRNEDDKFVEASIRELLEQGKYCPVHVSHIKVVYGKGKARAQEILQLLDSARTSGTNVTADFYPYTASYTTIGILFPDWAKQPNDYSQVLKSRRNELATYLRNRVNLRNGPEATLIGSGPYKGKTLAQLSKEMNKPFEEILLDDIGPYGADGAYFIMNEALQEEFLKNPYVMICTDGSPTMSHPRSYGAFAKIIETYVVQKQLLTLPEAVRKMTGLPALTIGVYKRGLIKPGYKADILLFDPAAVKENATFDKPNQLASGFQFILVNGQVVKEGDKFSEGRMGVVLKKQ
ncbi:N-acyl-D-amino-acid deacylase family protein [Pontibacter cellulosilyticus]|uniref:Amidohydrolase family protein n=1 Tax=Pontibacter cellulosilyticus TaxID=1720253 RepID=A0A923SPU5_9BACT|nr:amidohydrolase family protein [Pontibacter cellulosilyticus]MBC5994495.1 amidohydrolase family protein [Pontibacter cellulosilyticus]